MKRKKAVLLPYVLLLQVNDSWFFPEAKIASVSVAASNARKRFPERRYLCATEGSGVRIFRIA